MIFGRMGSMECALDVNDSDRFEFTGQVKCEAKRSTD